MTFVNKIKSSAGLSAGIVLAVLLIVLAHGSIAEAGIRIRYHSGDGFNLGLRLHHGYRYGRFYRYRRYYFPHTRYYSYRYIYGYPYGYSYSYDNDRPQHLGLFGRPHLGFGGTYGGFRLGLPSYTRRYRYYDSHGGSYSGSYTDYDDYNYNDSYSDSAPDYSYSTKPAHESVNRDEGQQGDKQQDGWTLLSRGRSSLAVSRFSQQARDNPKDGRYKVGFALALADDGNLSGGVWAMRRAMRLSPKTFQTLQLNESVQIRVPAILDKFASGRADYIGDGDRAFTRAALHYLLGDSEKARHFVRAAGQAGDKSQSTANLAELLGVVLEQKGDKTGNGGWSLLAASHPRQALLWFAHRATDNPQAARPKVGYALAVAADGNLSRGVWAMRRAFRLHGPDIVYMVLDEPLHKPVGKLIDAYDAASPDTVDKADSAFMRAAMNYLIGRYKSAEALAETARRAGDKSRSIEQLETMLAGDAD